MTLDALTPTGPYHAHRRTTITDVSGTPYAELSLIPRLLATRTLKTLAQTPPLERHQRKTALEKAATIFLEDTIAGLTYDQYTHAVAQVSGVPITIIKNAGHRIAHACTKADYAAYQAQPQGAVDTWTHPNTLTGTGLWTRRGTTLTVLAAGNHPGPNELWLEALALGYHLAIRPSRREPFTPHRLGTALQKAGFTPHRITYLPTDHDTADTLLQQADHALVYGNDTVVNKYRHHPTVIPQGPGRSKILITADTDWRPYLNMIIDSITHHAGVACLNTTTILTEHDPTPLAQA
ncbi:aldehyde dehydrogenase, partial [Streptomyces sp. NRRL B-1568]